MRLWTIQTVTAWEVLQQQRILRAEKHMVWGGDDPGEEVKRAYDWMREQMERRIGPRPSPEAYPVWAWAQWNGARHPRPDLRAREYLPAGTRGVRLEVEIPEERVLLSDFELWHYPLNYWYLPDSDEDDQRFEQRCAEKGVNFYQMKPLPNQMLHEQLMASWEHIFDLAWIYEPVTGATRREDRRIQATFWTVLLEDVRPVRSFRAR
jgi:hypothetical protein